MNSRQKAKKYKKLYEREKRLNGIKFPEQLIPVYRNPPIRLCSEQRINPCDLYNLMNARSQEESDYIINYIKNENLEKLVKSNEFRKLIKQEIVKNDFRGESFIYTEIHIQDANEVKKDEKTTRE